MPRFHFNVRDDQEEGLIEDEEGVELCDTNAARDEAEQGAREMLANSIKGGAEVNGKIIEITSESGEIVGTVNLRDLLNETH